jgi:putative Mg2+ transporter-C (MgtC) family protein
LHPALPEAISAETRYEILLACRLSVAAHIRALLLSTIAHLPVRLQSIHGEQDDKDQTNLTAELTTPGRNNEALEQVVIRLSLEDDVSMVSWSIVESTME